MNQHQGGAPDAVRLPGSDGEHRVQEELGTGERARRFYDEQVCDRLNEQMREFIARQEMLFLSTADAKGECDSSFRAGPPGFVVVLDDRTLAYPEYRGNGVMASLGNIKENPHVGMLLMDFGRERIGLHVNGRARMVSDELMRIRRPDLPVDPVPGRRPQVWVAVDVVEAYIHCAKHIPHLVKATANPGAGRAWGTDDVRRKGGDYFGAAAERRAGGPDGPPRPRQAPAPAVPSPAVPARVTVAVGGPADRGAPRAAAEAATAEPEPAAPPTASPAPPAVPAARRPSAGPRAPGADVGERARLAVRSRADRAGLPDPDMWRREAERALARARAGGGPAPEAAPPEPVPPVADEAFRGWFG